MAAPPGCTADSTVAGMNRRLLPDAPASRELAGTLQFQHVRLQI
jgi:hypothetical protein